jgi:hypothetical protein
MTSSDGKIWGTISTIAECDQPVKGAKGNSIAIVANYDLEKHPA